MWGVEAISWMNENYVRKARELQPPTPLDVLIERMRKPAPISVQTLISIMARADDRGEFIDMVDDLLPKHRQEILREIGPERQIRAFCELFEKEYFELEEEYILEGGSGEGYSDLTDHIPVYILGISYEDYDDLARNGDADVILMTYLLEDPWNDDGNRVALADSASHIIDKEILKKVPAKGFQHEYIDEMVKGSKYETYGLWCKIICHNTKNYFYDTDNDVYSNGGWPLWDKPTVDHLTKKWKETRRWEKQIEKFREWLRLDLKSNFEELLNFLLKRKEELKINDDDSD